jgi:membrane fusion protein (multidrug efflux system)
MLMIALSAGRPRSGTFSRSLLRLYVAAALLAVAGSASAQALPVIVSQVARENVADRIEAIGTLFANETARLTATITETISDVRFSDGQRVSAGDVLVAMTNREQLAQLDEARAAVEEARLQYDRVSELAASRQAAQSMLDERRRDLDTTRARLRAVESRLADRLIRAPFDGVVGLRNVSVGSLLTPGTVVAILHDDSTMKLDFSVPETLLGRLEVGLPVTARTRAFSEHDFNGEISSIDNQVDPITRSVQVRALIPNQDRMLRPGMLMTLEIDTRRRESMVIPEEALLPQGRDNFVMVVRGDGDEARAERRRVELGARRAGAVEVLSGLEVDERVVTHGNFRLSDGQRVQVRATAAIGDSVRDALAELPSPSDG